MDKLRQIGQRRGLMQQVEKPKDGKNALKRLLLYFNKEKLILTILLCSVVVISIFSVVLPSLQSTGIDHIKDGQLDGLYEILKRMIVIAIILGLFTLVQSRLSATLSQRIVKSMREDLFKKIVNLPIKYIDTHPHGDIMSRMTNDIENVSNTVSQSLSSLVSGVLTICATVFMMFYYSWQLAILSLTTILLTVTVTRYLSKTMKKFYQKRQALLGKVNSTVEEMVVGYKTVVSYSKEEDIITDFNETADELTKTGIIAETLAGSMGPIMNFINNASFVIIAVFGGIFAVRGIITVGAISAFIIYAKQFGRPINEIAQLYGQIQTALASAERVFAVMDEESEDKSGDITLENTTGVVTFRNVNFSYQKEKQVLYDFNLEVKAGQKVALVGATGSGKTTVVNLLMRFYDIDGGEILIDGVNIKDMNIQSLRDNTGIVLQDTILFSDTIKNNLMYSKEDATMEELVEATKISNSYGMIKRLKKGFESKLAESGQNISQGQRQLLSIARAFLKNPTILILDEATSSVDTRTEKHIQDAMLNLMKNRTSLIIAHRLSTIQDADVIVVMDQGRIIEQGNHEELIAQQGKYYELYMTQFMGNAI